MLINKWYLYCSERNAGVRATVCQAEVFHAHLQRVLRLRRGAEAVLAAGEAVSYISNLQLLYLSSY